MKEKTPGQVVYEAHRSIALTPVAWDDLRFTVRDTWETAAEALLIWATENVGPSL